jgi:hypothetical protein
LGWTVTVCPHLALSLELAAPWRARDPLWTGEETTDPRFPEHDQGDNAPASKPELDRMLAA